jgi:hypothetical protein
MPRIIDYADVLARMTSDGFRSLYHNSGAFGFPPDRETFARGWIGPADSTIRPDARAIVHSIPPPHEANLAALTTGVWLKVLPGVAWVMPKSHWSYELDFGSKAWLPGLLNEIGIDSQLLVPRNNAAALEFASDESESFARFIEGLLQNLLGSDFSLAWPGRAIVATVHHHKQIWWITSNLDLPKHLDAVVS